MEQENILKWVTAARTLDGYRLHLTFNDGSERIFDCLPLIEKYQLFASEQGRPHCFYPNAINIINN